MFHGTQSQEGALCPTVDWHHREGRGRGSSVLSLVFPLHKMATHLALHHFQAALLVSPVTKGEYDWPESGKILISSSISGGRVV